MQSQEACARSLQGKVAVVTGGSSGMGAAIAEELARHGANVAIVGRNCSRLARTLSRVEAVGPHGLAIAVDLTVAGGPERVVSETVDLFGNLDILINAAGLFLTAPPDGSLPGFDAVRRQRPSTL